MEQVQQDNMQTRMQAVAKLKRAASLPRMKDGRRPPMHSEAVSDGEKGHSGGSKNGDASPPDAVLEVPTEAEVEGEVEQAAEDEEAERAISPAPASRAKRRSRSRSRSRGSKDFKGKIRATQSPTPTSQLNGDSSPDEAPPPPSLDFIGIPGTISPHFMEFQRIRMLRSPTPTSPDPPLFNSGMLPTLEDIQRGLLRSNSVGHNARVMAIRKLTGGTEIYDPSPLTALTRNNTAPGGERIAARKNMLNRLGGRITRETDGELASGEDHFAPAPSPSPKRRRRRSRSHRASHSQTGMSDSEVTSTSANTPVAPSTPLPMSSEPLPRSRSSTPFQVINPQILPSTQFIEDNQVDQAAQQRELLELPRRRSVVVEEDDDPPSPTSNGLFPINATPRLAVLRAPHFPDLSPTNGFSDHALPPTITFSNQRTPNRTPPGSIFSRPFPAFPTEVARQNDFEDDEQVLYGTDTHRPRTPFTDVNDREISWIATPVPQIEDRMPIDDDEDDAEEEEEEGDDHANGEQSLEEERDETPLSQRSSAGLSSTGQATFNDTSLRISTDSKSLIVESETSPVTSTYIPFSPVTVPISQTSSIAPVSDESMSPRIYPTRLSVASRPPDFLDAEERVTADTPSKRTGDGPSILEKVISTFSRAGSNSGRRSRTNSFATRERRDQVDSGINRESGASLTSQQPMQSLMQSPSASASILSLVPHPPARAGPSPIPPASPADLSKYQDAKLFPFPGIKVLEEQRRAKLPSASASTPDVTISNSDGDFGSLSTHSPTGAFFQSTEASKDHKLLHQTSDSFLGKLKTSPSAAMLPASLNPSVQSPARNGLPTTVAEVKSYMKWKRSPFARSTSPAVESRPPLLTQIPSLPDLFSREQLEGGWEEIGISPSEVVDVFASQLKSAHDSRRENCLRRNGSMTSRTEIADTERTPKAKKLLPPLDHTDYMAPQKASTSPAALLSQTDLFSSATPDPSSSLSDYPARSTSESSSTTSSGYSDAIGLQGQAVLEKLGEDLTKGSLNRVWSLDDDTRRKLLLSSPVFQVVNANTLKDRFLFLFNDILVIAKPVISDQDGFIDIYKPSPLDRKYIVKSVVMLDRLRFNAERTGVEASPWNHPLSSRSPLLRSFVQIFATNPDAGIDTLLSKSGKTYDPVALGQLLFKCSELDRNRHGEYLIRRSSKSVLKSYLDSFGFVGIRVDIALRVFLLSMYIPARTSHNHHGLEYLLDAFASRWYEANAKLVDYDKDCAHRLVRAIIQLNELIHDGIAQEVGLAGHPRRDVTSGDFVEAFRRYDPRYLVPDRLLEEIHKSISEERLSHATSSGSNHQDIAILLKRPIPARLTWKIQSEPIIFRLPHVDPDFTIKLHGQDLVFDPPVLNFVKSAEASFRVTGLSLGSKSIILCRSGPNAVKYTGLPSSSPIVVERAFMRHTFQVAFQNHHGMKRRYMFSVDDSLLRHQWVSYLKQHISNATELAKLTSASTSKFRCASENIAFRVLQDMLMGLSPTSLNGRQKNHQRINRFSLDRSGQTPKHNGYHLPSLHVRSKSRSKVYHRHGAGKNEIESNHSQDSSGNDTSEQGYDRSEDILWSARDLELHCKQNSAIVSVLFTYLQDSEQDIVTS